MLKEFQKFIMRGNVLDLAVGIIIGAAFTSIVNSLVNDVVMPIVGLITGGVDFSNIFVTLKDGASAGPYATLAAAQEAGAVTINLGVFINAVVNFLIVGFVIFMIVRSFNTASERFQKKEAEIAAAAPPAPTAEEKLTAAIEKLTAVMEKKA